MQTQGFAEATDAVRDGEVIVQAFIEKLREVPALERTYHEGIFCFRRQVNLHETIVNREDKLAGDISWDNREKTRRITTVIVLHEERECSAFTEWHLDTSPKEHQEMADRDVSIRQRRFECRLHLGIAFLAVVVAATSIVIGAL